jgi:hypothetical protein
MNKTHPAFWGAGWAGMFTGALLVVISVSAPADVASLAGGYGLMLIGSALFLLAGLKLRGRSAQRTAPAVNAGTRVTAASRS